MKLRKIMIIGILGLAALSLLGVFGYFVVHGLITLGYPAVILLGAMIIAVGGIVATARNETNHEPENQLSIQRWAMQNATHSGDVLEPVELQLQPVTAPTTWHVRKQDDGLGYSILPLIKGAPQWDLAILTDVKDPVAAHNFADSATRRAIAI
jgi:hypothetical protein